MNGFLASALFLQCNETEMMLIVTHMPKTGGTTLRRYLSDVYGKKLFQEYRLVPSPALPLWRRAFVALGSERAKIPPGTSCIIGHFRATKYLSVLPNARHAVWLRDPVERVLSHFHFNLRHPEAVKAEWHGLSLERFLEHPFVANNQAWVLDGRPLRDFDFVGDFECFNTSLQVFARQFALPAPSHGMILNNNPERLGSKYEVSDELRARILELNTEDQALYLEAKELFRQRMETMAMIQ